MDNPETQATICTRHRKKTNKTKTQKIKTMNKKLGLAHMYRKVKQFMFLIRPNNLSLDLYRRGIFIIDRYILYSSYDFRFTPRTQCFCTDVVYLLLTGTFCIRLMTFVSPLRLNVSVQTWYIYY